MSRILGAKYAQVFTALSSFEVWVASIIYFLLLNRTLYAITTFVMYMCGYKDYADPNSSKIIFSQYSI